MHLDKIVIGNCFESVFYAFTNDCYHTHTCNLRPLFFEEYEDFRMFGTSSRKELWLRFKYYNGLMAKNLDYKDLESIRIKDNSIKFFDSSLLDQYTFGQCVVFDTDKVVHENKIRKQNPETYMVLDDFTLSRISPGKVQETIFSTEDDFIRKAYFYNSGRVEGSKHPTDIVSISKLTKEQLYQFDFSDTMAKFKLASVLANNGYKGRYEKGKYKNGQRIYKKLEIKHINRFVFREDNNLYHSNKNVIISKIPLKKIIDGKFKKGHKYGRHHTASWLRE